VAALAGCRNQPAEVAHPHYVLGAPYQAAGVWHYPHESYDLDETGLAQVIASGHPGLTADGEAFDQTALAAAHATLQLPAIARVTNLETGRAVLVRINDRGSGTPHRVIELTRRAAILLGMAPEGLTPGAVPPAGVIAGVIKVRVQVLPAQSHDVVDGMPDAPHLAMAAAPRGAVEVAELPPPPGARGDSRMGCSHALARSAAEAPDPPAVAVPLRLPETVTQNRPAPGRLWVRLDSFAEYQYAAVLRSRVAGLGPRITQVTQGRTAIFRVEVGPLNDVRRADAVLDEALAAGIPDARIVVE
jgi:rare lipoprotein A